MDRLEAMSVLLSAVEAGSPVGRFPVARYASRDCQPQGFGALKTRLLNRSSRQLTLTHAGRSYVAACKRILEEVREAERAASGNTARRKVTSSSPRRLFSAVCTSCPSRSSFSRSTRTSTSVSCWRTACLVSLKTRLILPSGSARYPTAASLRRVGSIRHVVCASPTYFAKRGQPKSPQHLGSHDCVSFEILTSPDTWIFATGKSDGPVAIRSRLIVNTAEAAIDAAVAGIGITRVLSYQIATATRAGTLAVALREFEPAPWPVSLVHSDGRPAASDQRRPTPRGTRRS